MSKEVYDEVLDEKYSGVKYNLVSRESSREIDSEKIQRLVDCGMLFADFGWAPAYNQTGSSGNLSFRDEGGVVVTATNTSLGNLKKEDMMRVVDVDYGTDPPTVYYETSGDRKPTSELLAHWEIYKKRSDISVILHGHDQLTTRMAGVISRYSPSSAGRTEKNLPYGTKEFAHALRDITDDNRFYLVAKGHGFFSLGEKFDQALFYSRVIHFLTQLSRPYVALRHSRLVEAILPNRLNGGTRKITHNLEGLVKLAAKLGGANVYSRVGKVLVGLKPHRKL